MGERVKCLLKMWSLRVHVISTGSESPRVRENHYSVLLITLCTKFKNDSVKNILYETHLVLIVPVQTACADLRYLSNSINTVNSKDRRNDNPKIC